MRVEDVDIGVQSAEIATEDENASPDTELHDEGNSELESLWFSY